MNKGIRQMKAGGFEPTSGSFRNLLLLPAALMIALNLLFILSAFSQPLLVLETQASLSTLYDAFATVKSEENPYNHSTTKSPNSS